MELIMKVIYNEQAKKNQCILCLKWNDYCFQFKITQTINFHPSYRTLETFKCSVCSNCRQKGDHHIEKEIHQYMNEYIGQKHT